MRQERQRGFTLIELMVVIVLMGVMTTLAVSSMSAWIGKNRVQARAHQTATLLRFARAEAIRLNRMVKVCFATIRDDGKPNAICNDADRPQLRQGLVAFAVDGKAQSALFDRSLQDGYRSDRDETLKTVVFSNGSSGGQVSIDRLVNISLGGSRAAISAPQANALIFFPDGRGVGRVKQAASGQQVLSRSRPVAGDAYVRLDIKDNTHGAIVKVLLDPGGRTTICPDSGTDIPKACQFLVSS